MRTAREIVIDARNRALAADPCEESRQVARMMQRALDSWVDDWEAVYAVRIALRYLENPVTEKG